MDLEFVQFHPSYDYSDFVEGLRPKVNGDGTMGFELQDGIFKKFVARARKNYEDSQKSKETVEKELTVREAMAEFFKSLGMPSTLREFGIKAEEIDRLSLLCTFNKTRAIKNYIKLAKV